MDSILFKEQDNVAIITLNRPEKFNAFNRAMALKLQEVLKECDHERIRCVLITGSGKAFSAGQDLGEVTGESAIDFNKILSEHYNPVIRLIRTLEKPVVAAVNGIAAGAGANIALCCDVVVAASSASFLQAFSKIGLIPDSSGTYFLPRLIGFQKASALMMLGEKISANEAEKLGMIYKALDDQDFQDAALKIAIQLASMPTRGLALTKRALNDSMSATLEQQLAKEDELQALASKTYDYNEGVNAFIQKRNPEFKGK